MSGAPAQDLSHETSLPLIVQWLHACSALGRMLVLGVPGLVSHLELDIPPKYVAMRARLSTV